MSEAFLSNSLLTHNSSLEGALEMKVLHTDTHMAEDVVSCALLQLKDGEVPRGHTLQHLNGTLRVLRQLKACVQLLVAMATKQIAHSNAVNVGSCLLY